MVTTPEALAEAEKAYMVSPAGYGKTQVIAQAVASTPNLRQLVLTHTHAGVDALRKRMRTLGAKSSSYHIETIAGFALRYAAAYPNTSELKIVKPTSGEEWDQVYAGFSKLLENRHIQDVLKISYNGLYVDEYQDCTVQQHGLILKLSKLFPCRLLGDPLQGIYGFGNNTLVNWNNDIKPHFNSLPPLEYPWRWHKTDQKLGLWLSKVRVSLESGQPVNLNDAPTSVSWIPLPSDPQRIATLQRNACLNALQKGGDVIVIHPQFERQSNNFVRQLGGRYQAIETIECADLVSFSKKIYESQGIQRALAVIEFSEKCFSRLSSISALQTMKKAFKNGKTSSPRTNLEQVTAINAVISDNSMGTVLKALESISALHGIVSDRKELFWAMCQALQNFENGEFESLLDASWEVRDRTRKIGRKLPRFAVGRTLLIKGLEFDHAIILDADALDVKNLYVAMTRGSRSLTILSRQKTIVPARPRNG